MPSRPDRTAGLHETRRPFYHSDASYRVEERQATATLTPGRERLFGWIRSGERVLDVGEHARMNLQIVVARPRGG